MSYVYLNHLTIETTSPLAIGTGEREIGFDNQLIRDVNKLPYIPSTSIAGVWRSLANLRLGNDITDKWFGHLETKSKLTISQGYLLDTHQNVVKGLLSKERIQADPLLTYLQQSNPMHRERVRLNDRGVATEKGKFDQILLPSGLRFNVTLQWQGESESELDQFKELLALWQDNQLAFGSNTTNGLGQTKLISQSASLISLCDDPSAGKALRTARTNYANRNEIIATPEQPFCNISPQRYRDMALWPRQSTFKQTRFRR
ncbi:RAMP superfamily CRISPR-associated protein [Vibrio sinaloensis]|nr:RAMP superfamily CRISPR-associated protein [Vibrio sinaloensis]